MRQERAAEIPQARQAAREARRKGEDKALEHMDGQRPGSAWADRATLLALVLAVPLLAIAVQANPSRLNPDAVAYLQLALHWRAGDIALAVSGYWGPLFPWMTAVLLHLVPDAMLAGRIVMATSAFGFLAAGCALLRALDVPPPARMVGAACLLAFTLGWSVAIMTPDLMVSALLAAAVAIGLQPAWLVSRRRQAAVAVMFALAFHAKAVALPLGLLLLGTIAAWQLHRAGRAAMAPTLRTAALAALLVAPWITVLSVKYGTPSMGTSGSINLALAGPDYHAAAGGRFDPHHPAFTSFHRPREGRVTAWEEATELPYRSWSPLADAASARHLLRLLRHNLALTVETLRGFDALGLGLAAAIAVPFLSIGPPVAWRFALVPVVLVAGIYLPALSNGEPRYLMLCYPLLLAAAGGLFFAWRPTAPVVRPLHGLAATLLLAGTFMLPLRHDVAIALGGRANPSFVAAQEVAAAARDAGVTGGIASVGELGFAAIFTAFLLREPFLGTEAELPALARLRTLGAGVVLVARGSAAEAALATDAAAEPLSVSAAMLSAWRLR